MLIICKHIILIIGNLNIKEDVIVYLLIRIVVVIVSKMKMVVNKILIASGD